MIGDGTAEYWVLKLARERPQLTPTELHVLLALAARHNRDYHASFPKLKLVAAETHISERQIMRLINDLSTGERPVLHISYGVLPMQPRNGRVTYGNWYRFIGLDPIPADVAPRRQVGGRPTSPDDTMSSELDDPTSSDLDDTMSSESDDTGDVVQMTSEAPSDDTGDTVQMTSLNSPVKPGTEPGRNPELEPGARAPARETAPPKKTNEETARARAKPTDSITGYECHQVVDTLDYKRQHSPKCSYFGLYPLEVRARRAMLRDREKREEARLKARAETEQLAATG